MQGAPCLGESKEQAARSIFVIRVILDDVCMLPGLSDFQIADVTLHSPLKGVVAEFELPADSCCRMASIVFIQRC